MKKVVTKEEIESLNMENQKVIGTKEYQKYHMEAEVKYEKDGKMSVWKFIGHGIPNPQQYSVKKFKDKIYLVREYTVYGEKYFDRYTVTDAVNEILKIV